MRPRRWTRVALTFHLLTLPWPFRWWPSSPPPSRPGPPGAAPKPPQAVKVTTVEGITEYRLPNGLQILLLPDQTKPVATVNITYLVGSRHESYGETGMAHLLEHLLFKGSTGHPKIGEEMTAHGAQFNGTTWYDRTNYFESVPATADNLDWALRLEADRMVNSLHRRQRPRVRDDGGPERIRARARTTRRPSWRNGSSPPRTSGTTTGTPPSAPGPTSRTCRSSGCRGSTGSTTSRTTPCWWWRASSTRPRSLKRIEQLYGPIPRPNRDGANRLWPTYTVEPVQDGERTVTLRRVGDQQMHPGRVTTCPAGSDADFAADPAC